MKDASAGSKRVQSVIVCHSRVSVSATRADSVGRRPGRHVGEPDGAVLANDDIEGARLAEAVLVDADAEVDRASALADFTPSASSVTYAQGAPSSGRVRKSSTIWSRLFASGDLALRHPLDAELLHQLRRVETPAR